MGLPAIRGDAGAPPLTAPSPRPPGDRVDGPVGQLGRYVVDLLMAGHRLEYAGPLPEMRAMCPIWVFRIVCRDRDGRELWRVEEVDHFEWDGAARALARLQERFADTPRP